MMIMKVNKNFFYNQIRKSKSYFLLVFSFFYIFITFFPLKAIQNFNRSYFYRASGLCPEPRFEQAFLSTLTLSISGGETSCGSNCFGEKVPIVKLFQPCINEVEKIKKKKKARWRYNGDFDLLELNFNAYQTIGCNSFFHLHIPVIHTKFSPGMEIEYPLKTNFKSYENDSKLLCRTKSKWDLSDITLFAGITRNSYNVCCLDFIDYTFQAGILFPTSKSCFCLKPFDIPVGYNDRWGGTFMIDVAAGLFNWITLGVHGDATLLTSTSSLKYNTSASFSTGPVTRVGAFFKADHICYDLSFALAFSHEKKHKSGGIRPKFCNKAPEITKFCEQLDGWSRSIFHIIIEADGGLFNNFLLPEFAFSYHRQLSGKNVFNTNVLSGTFSFNACWFF